MRSFDRESLFRLPLIGGNALSDKAWLRGVPIQPPPLPRSESIRQRWQRKAYSPPLRSRLAVNVRGKRIGAGGNSMCVSHHHRLLNYYFSPIFETLPFSPLPLFFFYLFWYVCFAVCGTRFRLLLFVGVVSFWLVCCFALFVILI